MDIISGNAGAIPALLDMYNILHEPMLYDLAVKLGDELLQFAVKGAAGWSWDYKANGIRSTQYNLTGFSHGAAGIAYSLLELFRKTEDSRYRIAAQEGFKYENQWFNNALNNWPDFRLLSKSKKNNSEVFPYAMAWCHGAPGICLSRMRAYQILQDEKYLKDCQNALSAIIQSMKNRVDIGHDNYSLCHGVGGNCEPLILAREIFRDGHYRSLPIDVGIYGIERYGNEVSSWPCGISTGQTPGLMLGLSGIGQFYLRLYDSKHTPCIVML
jgi:lantibiotic modifying enzyme